MKTENEKFVLARLRARKQFLVELADEARWKAEEAATAYATCKGDADECDALFKKVQNLRKLQNDAEDLAFNAERSLYYAERGDEGNASYYNSVVKDYGFDL